MRYTGRQLALLRSNGCCEGCGAWRSHLDPHHRRARGAGGVHGAAVAASEDVRNFLALCRPCHDKTEHADTWSECEAKGWRVKQGQDPTVVPALICTVNGNGWWILTEDGGYLWANLDPEHRLLSS